MNKRQILKAMDMLLITFYAAAILYVLAILIFGTLYRAPVRQIHQHTIYPISGGK